MSHDASDRDWLAKGVLLHTANIQCVVGHQRSDREFICLGVQTIHHLWHERKGKNGKGCGRSEGGGGVGYQGMNEFQEEVWMIGQDEAVRDVFDVGGKGGGNSSR